MSDSPNESGPEVLHIGFSKCASTYLQAFFDDHPSIFLVNQSHFFAPFDFSDFHKGAASYKSLFDGAAQNQVRLESDEHIILPLFHPVLRSAATTMDSVHEVIDRINSVSPDVKIVMVIRNHASLIVSRYSEYILGGGKKTFAEFVEEYLRCSVDGRNYFENNYDAIAEALETHFSADRVLLLLQEDLARDEPAFMRRLCEFLGVEPFKARRRGVFSRRVGLSRLGLGVVQRFNRMFVTEQEMSSKRARTRIIPYLPYKVILRLMRMADYYLPSVIKGDKNQVLTAEIDDELRAHFAADNAALGRRLGRDLQALGYY